MCPSSFTLLGTTPSVFSGSRLPSFGGGPGDWSFHRLLRAERLTHPLTLRRYGALSGSVDTGGLTRTKRRGPSWSSPTRPDSLPDHHDGVGPDVFKYPLQHGTLLGVLDPVSLPDSVEVPFWATALVLTVLGRDNQTVSYTSGPITCRSVSN